MSKKNIFKVLLLCAGLSFSVSACDTDVEIQNPENLTDPARTEAYYENLRSYKQSDHPVAFGWFGNWVGSGASLENSLRGLPDSVDFVSIWGNWKNPSPQQLADLDYVRKVKGTRAMICFIVSNVGDQLTPAGVDAYEYWGYTEGDSASTVAAIQKYANQICDSIDAYGYDGFDYDYEPNYGHRGNISGVDWAEKAFVETLSKRLGPKSGTDKLLVIDGEPQSILSELGSCFNYFIVQAYACSGDANLNSRLRSTISNFNGYLTAEEVARKYIVTENFESYAATGGVRYTDAAGNGMQSLEGMARWNPAIDGVTVRKGGVGTYHMEYEYNPGKQPSYPALRKAIQIMNPTVK